MSSSFPRPWRDTDSVSVAASARADQFPSVNTVTPAPISALYALAPAPLRLQPRASLGEQHQFDSERGPRAGGERRTDGADLDFVSDYLRGRDNFF
jgi:hypothetical protein